MDKTLRNELRLQEEPRKKRHLRRFYGWNYLQE